MPADLSTPDLVSDATQPKPDAERSATLSGSSPGDADITDRALVSAWSDVVRRIEATQTTLQAGIEAAGVPAQWFAVLHLLLSAPEGRMPMSRIAKDVSMTGGGFTKLADRMARDGLIDRRGAPGDRRVVHATLTPSGEQLATRLEHIYLEALRTHVLGVMAPEDLQELQALAAKLTPSAAALTRSEPVAEALKAHPRDPQLPDRRQRPRD